MNHDSLNKLINFSDSLKDMIKDLEVEVNKNVKAEDKAVFNQFFSDIKKSVKGDKDINNVISDIKNYANSRQKNI